MADINKRKSDDFDTGEEVGTEIGAFPGDTMASALDPFGSVAAISLDNKVEEDTSNDNKHGSKNRD